MGWLELISLAKRLLPLLARAVPMLETVIAFRTANGKDTEAAVERISADLKESLAASSQDIDSIRVVLAEQASALRSLQDEVQALSASATQVQLRLEAVEKQAVSLTKSLRSFAIATILLLMVCVALLIAVLLRH